MSAELVAKLFKFKKEINLDGTILYMRIPGDQTVDDVRNEALLASRRLRKNLRDPSTDSYLLHIDMVEDIDINELRTACVNLSLRDVMRDYVNNNPKPPLPELGDNPTQEDQENLAEARLQRELDYTDSMRAYLEDWRNRYIESLQKAPLEHLKSVYKRLKTDRVCEEMFSSFFEDKLVSSSIYTDQDYKEHAFTIEEFKGLPTEFKKMLKDEFSELNVTGDDLKK